MQNEKKTKLRMKNSLKMDFKFKNYELFFCWEKSEEIIANY